MRRRMKAVSPLVATLIIVAITLAISVGLWLWINNTIKRNQNVEALSIADVEYVRNANGNYTVILKLQNTGTVAVNVTGVTINGVPQALTPTVIESGESVDFQFSNIALGLGVNSIVVQYTTPDGQEHYVAGEFYVG